MATPDDLEEFRSCQLTFRAQAAPWNDMSRGAAALDRRARRRPRRSACTPCLSGRQDEDEGLYLVQHDYWLRDDARPRWPPSSRRQH